ncbi:MAG: ParA family protein [Chloroflexales bacterium]
MARIQALANQKGGVAKTTTCLNLGAALAARGRRVLLVDLDPQANLTLGLGVDPYAEQATTYEVLLNPERGAAFAVQHIAERLDLIPATLDMAAAELELAGKIGRELLMREALAPLRDAYDYILIDPPPSLGLFTLNALVAADEVIIPLQVHIYALRGLVQLQKTVKLVQKLNPGLHIGGIVCTMVDRRNNLSVAVEGEIRERFGDLVYTTVIPQNIRLAEAPASGTPISTYDPTSTGAKAYAALAEEVDRG